MLKGRMQTDPYLEKSGKESERKWGIQAREKITEEAGSLKRWRGKGARAQLEV